MKTLPVLWAPTQCPSVVETVEQRSCGDRKRRLGCAFKNPSAAKVARGIATSVIAGLIVVTIEHALPNFSRTAPEKVSQETALMPVTLPPVGPAENDHVVRAALPTAQAEPDIKPVSAPSWPQINVRAVDPAPPQAHKRRASAAALPPPRPADFGQATNAMKGKSIEVRRLPVSPPSTASAPPVNTPSAAAETAASLMADSAPMHEAKPSVILKPLSDGVNLAMGAGRFATTADTWLIVGAADVISSAVALGSR